MKLTPDHSIKLGKFNRKMKGNVKKSLSQIGAVIAKQAKRNISGLGFTRNPSRNSKYPGILTGTLKSTLISKMGGSGTYVDIGSNVGYIKKVMPVSSGGTYRGKKITGNFLTDTLQQQEKKILDIFAGKLWKPLK